MPCVFVIHMRLRLANEFACKVVCISVRLEALKDALSQYDTNGGFLTGFPPEESAARLALKRPSVPVSSAPWSTQAASPVRQRRLT